ncbi:MAG: hypothetical protein ACE5I1_30490 [bacterium]
MSANGSIEFWNKSEYDAGVYTLDNKGKEKFVVDLGPDNSSTQSTASGQNWIVKDKETGEQVGSVTGSESYQLYEIKIKRSGGRGTPDTSGA